MLQQALRTKVHLLQAPRISIRTFRSSTRLNTNEFTGVFATKINKIEADVNGLKGDVSALKTDIRELGLRLERSMTERLGGHALNQEKKMSEHTLNQEKKMSQHTLNQGKQITQLYFHSICAVLGVTILLVGSSWILPIAESNRLDAEIKRRAILYEALNGE